jgi:hypothetical protein
MTHEISIVSRKTGPLGAADLLLIHTAGLRRGQPHTR